MALQSDLQLAASRRMSDMCKKPTHSVKAGLQLPKRCSSGAMVLAVRYRDR